MATTIPAYAVPLPGVPPATDAGGGHEGEVLVVGIGHHRELVAVGGELTGLVDGRGSLGRARVAAGEGGEVDQDGVATVVGGGLRGRP